MLLYNRLKSGRSLAGLHLCRGINTKKQCREGAVGTVISLYALLLGFAFDLLLGDPPGFPHMVVGMGKLISLLESGLRRLFPGTAKGELYGGTVLAITLPLFSSGLAWGLLYLCSLIHPLARLLVESLLCWQCLALRSLCDASMKVYTALKEDNLPRARLALGQIVGRDTKNLDAAGVTRAAVETVAENTNDGVIAPLLFLLAGGAAFGVFYKAVNTMDSMIGYKNSRYLYFGRAAALLDDLINFIPARIAGLLIVIAAYFLQLDARNAWRVFLRDRYNHTSPNSAQTESACAGALHLRLGGSSEYRGIIVHKPYIGDSNRLPRPGDICLANRLLCVSSFICLLLGVAVKGAILWF
jgi:adenosylcobinamide-phosphate synthase